MAPGSTADLDAGAVEHDGTDFDPSQHGLGFGTQDEPLQIGGPTEEWSAGITHWIVILVVAFIVWWLWSRFGGGDTTAGGGSSGSLGGTKSKGRPDAEEMRRKRLEALQKSSSASQGAPEASLSTDASSATSTSDGPRRRNVATVVADSNNTANASSKPGLNDKEREQPLPSTTVSAAEAVDQAPSETMVANGPKGETAPTEVAASTSATVPNSMPSASVLPEAPKPASTDAAPKELTAPETVAEAPEVSTAEVATTGTLQEYAVRVRGTLSGATTIKTVGGLSPSTSVEELHNLVRIAFGPQAQDCRLRLVFNGKELKNSDVQVSSMGITTDSLIQAMFLSDAAKVATPPSPPVATSEASPGTAGLESSTEIAGNTVTSNSSMRDTTAMVPFAIRVNGTFRGSPVVHMIEDLVASTSVRDLHDRVIAAYEAGTDVHLRLFYMGKELKDPTVPLSTVGLKPGVTVIATFANKPKLETPMAGQSSDAAAPNAGAQQQVPGLTPETMAAACNLFPGGNPTNASLATADATNSGPVSISPEEAWRAMAGLEEQLSRVDDTSEVAQVKQAAAILRQMLVTVTHDNNPALLQLAQTIVPDFSKIWNYEPTRDHLRGLLQPNAGRTDGGTSASSSQPADGSAAASNSAA